MAFLIFYTTHPDEAAAKNFSEKILERRLAACANIFPIQSTYHWAGAQQSDDEWVALLKTAPELENAFENFARSLHGYEVPCLLRWEVRANSDYENWIRESVDLLAAAH